MPAVRVPQQLIDSLDLGSRRPDLVTIVSNEVPELETHGMNVRVLGFKSDWYCYGENDVVLRRNIGIWWAQGDELVFLDDDEIACWNLVETTHDLLMGSSMIWGHHRFVDFEGRQVEEVMGLFPGEGRSRETMPNRYHGWYSSYAGMMAAKFRFLRDELGGFDMAFVGRHAGEDQHLGRRQMKLQNLPGIYVHEPPFAWHPLVSPPRAPLQSNSCWEHDLVFEADPGGQVNWSRCVKCPYRVAEGDVSEPRLLVPFVPTLVEVDETYL